MLILATVISCSVFFQVHGEGLAGAKLLEGANADERVHLACKVLLVTHYKDLRRPSIALFTQVQLLAEELADECDILRVKEAVNLIHD